MSRSTETPGAVLHQGPSSLGGRVGLAQWAELLDILEPKLTSTIDRNLMEAIRGFCGTPDKLRLDSKVKRLAETKA